MVLELPKGERWVIEIKRSLQAKPEKGFHIACEDLKPARRFVVHAGSDRYPLAADLDAIGVRAMARMLADTA